MELLKVVAYPSLITLPIKKFVEHIPLLPYLFSTECVSTKFYILRSSNFFLLNTLSDTDQIVRDWGGMRLKFSECGDTDVTEIVDPFRSFPLPVFDVEQLEHGTYQIRTSFKRFVRSMNS